MQSIELNPLGCKFYGSGDEADLDDFEQSLRHHRDLHQRQDNVDKVDSSFSPVGGVAAVFTEFPTNPLLKCPNLLRWVLSFK